MTRSDCRASKIIWNDTKLEPVSWVLNIENHLFSIYVGVWVRGRMRQTFDIYKKIRKKILHLLISMSSWWVTMQMLNQELTKNWKLWGFKLRGFDVHAYECHPCDFKNWVKILKSNFQRIGPKFWYPQNQHDFEIISNFLK